MVDFEVTNKILDVLYRGYSIVMVTLDYVVDGKMPISELDDDLDYMKALYEDAMKNNAVDKTFLTIMWKKMQEDLEKEIADSGVRNK